MRDFFIMQLYIELQFHVLILVVRVAGGNPSQVTNYFNFYGFN